MKNYEKSIFYTDVIRLRKENSNFKELLKYRSVYIQSFAQFYDSKKSYLNAKTIFAR